MVRPALMASRMGLRPARMFSGMASSRPKAGASNLAASSWAAGGTLRLGGATEYMKVAKVTNLNRTLELLKERGLWVTGADMAGEPYDKADLTGPMALVIGAEGEGISSLVLKNCDRTVSLPMKGKIESLNASVAAGVLMYAVMSARGV